MVNEVVVGELERFLGLGISGGRDHLVREKFGAGLEADRRHIFRETRAGGEALVHMVSAHETAAPGDTLDVSACGEVREGLADRHAREPEGTQSAMKYIDKSVTNKKRSALHTKRKARCKA